jgi:HEAT repeat protein
MESELDIYKNMIKSENLEEALSAVQILSQIPDIEAKRILIDNVNHPLWQIRNSIVEVLQEIIEKDDVPLLVDKIKSQNAKERNAARSILKERGDIAIPYLIENLKSSDVDVRILSLNTLGMIKAREAISDIAVMLDDDDQNVRESAIEALGILKAELEVSLLTEKMEEAEDEWSKIPYIIALGDIGASYPIPYLIKYLDSDIMQLPVIETLGKIGDERGIIPLLNFLSSDDEDIVVATVLSLTEIINNIKDILKEEGNDWILNNLKNKIKESMDKTSIDNFFKVLNNFSEEQTINILEAFKWAELKIKISTLILFLEKEEINELVEEILLNNSEKDKDIWKLITDDKYGVLTKKSLLKFAARKEKIKKKILMNLMNSNEELIKVTIFQEFGDKLNEKELLDLFNILKKEKNREVMSKAAIVFAKYKNFEPKFIESANAGEENVKEMAIRALGMMRSDYLDENITLFINDSSPKVRAMALRSMGYYYADNRDKVNYDVINSIGSLINDEDYEVKDEVIIALGRIGTDEAIDFLLTLLEPDRDINFSLLFNTLADFDKEVVWEKFKDILESSQTTSFIYFVIENIAKLKIKDFNKQLYKYLDVEDPYLLSAVLESLSNGEIEEEDVLKKISGIIETSGDWTVVSNGIKIIKQTKYFPGVTIIKNRLKKQKEETPDYVLKIILLAFKEMNVYCQDLIYFMFASKKFFNELFEYMIGLSETYHNKVITLFGDLRSCIEKRNFLRIYRTLKTKESISHLKLALKEKSVSVRGTAYIHLYNIYKETGDNSLESIGKLELEEIDPFLLNFKFDWCEK